MFYVNSMRANWTTSIDSAVILVLQTHSVCSVIQMSVQGIRYRIVERSIEDHTNALNRL